MVWYQYNVADLQNSALELVLNLSTFWLQSSCKLKLEKQKKEKGQLP